MVSNYVGICECIKDDFKFLCDETYLELVKDDYTDDKYAIYNNKYLINKNKNYV